jgi:hypothetical protein
MAATSRPQQHPNRRSQRRRILDSLRTTVGRGRARVNRIRLPAPQHAGAIGRPGLRRVRALRDRSVAGIRHLIGQSVRTTRHLPARASRQANRLTRHGPNLGAGRTIPTAGEPVDRAPSAPSPSKASYPSVGRAAERRLAAAEPTTASERHPVEVKPATARGRTRRTRQRQAKPRQAKHSQDLALEQQTVQQLRQRAREAGIKGRSSMTKDQLIKALHDHR